MYTNYLLNEGLTVNMISIRVSCDRTHCYFHQVVLHYQSMSEPAQIRKLISQLHKGTGEVIKKKPRSAYCIVILN